MTVQTIYDFSDAVDAETAWRRHELTNLLLGTRSARNALRPMMVRAGVTLLYAHWEGWIKSVGSLYIDFLTVRRLRYDELQSALAAFALRPRIQAMLISNSPGTFLDAFNLLRGELSERATFRSAAIEAKANLSSDVLQEIVTCLGLSFRPYELRRKLIDEKLLKSRNQIAHGEYLPIDLVEYEDVHREIIEMATIFTNDVLNAAASGAYRC